jgi:hypothetical protein
MEQNERKMLAKMEQMRSERDRERSKWEQQMLQMQDEVA